MINPRSEIRNPKEVRTPKAELYLGNSDFWGWGHFGFRHPAFGKISAIGHRALEFPPLP